MAKPDLSIALAFPPYPAAYRGYGIPHLAWLLTLKSSWLLTF